MLDIAPIRQTTPEMRLVEIAVADFSVDERAFGEMVAVVSVGGNWGKAASMLELAVRISNARVRPLIQQASVALWLDHVWGGLPVALQVRLGRLLLPPYRGPALTLYRGVSVAADDAEVRRCSWTTSQKHASRYAMPHPRSVVGEWLNVIWENFHPSSDRCKLEATRRLTGTTWRAVVPAAGIVCHVGKFLAGSAEDEVFIDPSFLPVELERVPAKTVPAYGVKVDLRPFRQRMRKLREKELRSSRGRSQVQPGERP